MPHSIPDLIALMSGQSRAVAYDLVSPLVRFLIIARETCGGDLDQALLMLVITLRASEHPDFRRPDAIELARGEIMPGLGTNLRSLADSTGIPKETVRRKVQRLIDIGWVVRDGSNLHYSLSGYRAVAVARDAIISMYARGFQAIEALD